MLCAGVEAKIVIAGTRRVVAEDYEESEESADDSEVEAPFDFLIGRGWGLLLEGPGASTTSAGTAISLTASKGVRSLFRCLPATFLDTIGALSLSRSFSIFSDVLRVRRATAGAGGEFSTLIGAFKRAGPFRSMLPEKNKRRPRGAAESCGGGPSVMTGALPLFIAD